MHSQVLVIYPPDVDINDVMYWYQEIDKNQNDKMYDNRCNFILTIPEKEIPFALDNIEEYLKRWQKESLESLEYRSRHSYEEWQNKFNGHQKDLNIYEFYSKEMKKLEKVKNMDFDDPRQIKFIKSWSGYPIEIADIYIKGRGYGAFDNQYELWDYWLIVNEMRFPPDTKFLCMEKSSLKYNQLKLSLLDIEKTVENINTFTRVWNYIIFCADNSSDTKLYTTEPRSICRDDDCIVDSLESKLKEIKENAEKEYVVTAIDFHY